LKKVRNLRFLGILGVGIAVLFLMSISVTQAQVSIQVKPDKPGKPPKPDDPPDDPVEEFTWAVRIPTLDSDSMFYGMGGGYYENGSNIEVSVKKNPISGPYKKYFNFSYAFDFILTNENVESGVLPPADQLGFKNVSDLYLYDIGYPNPGPVGIFPVGGGILAFLNNLHPYSDGTPENNYESIWFEVHIFDQDIELMEPGEKYVFGSDRVASDPGDYFSIWARYREGCSPEPLYHDVELYRNINVERAMINGNTPNVEIERIDENTWRFWVRPTGYLKVKERYCTIVKRKARTVYSMEAKADFSFYIDFIKIPPSTS